MLGGEGEGDDFRLRGELDEVVVDAVEFLEGVVDFQLGQKVVQGLRAGQERVFQPTRKRRSGRKLK